MAIQIQTSPMIINTNTQNASLAMSGNGVKTLNIETVDASLSYVSQAPQLRIDQTACFSEAGLKNLKDFMSDAISYGRQKIQEGIARIVSDGNQMAAIENKGDPIPYQALKNAYDMFDKEFNYGVIPKSRPQINVIRGGLNFDYSPSRVINNSQPIKVDVSYSPGSVDTYVQQYNSISIDFIL